MAPRKTIGSRDVHAAIERLAAAIRARHPETDVILMLGIANGGIALARRLARRLGIRRVGDLDISFHRDDIATHPIPKEYTPTLLPGDVNGACVVIVDDVLFTGRTVKAALDELFDHGRPARVELAVLVDRGSRTLPVTADFSGARIDAADDEDVVVRLDDDEASDRIEILARGPERRRAAAAR
ncbi:MAG TPA: bifunctional pyr operon transcriptional regulator/uracil phosphoribosyltransferase PyrR [Opitutaceae bacterium]